MINGVLIAESLRVGAVIDAVALTVREIRRSSPDVVTTDQPNVWTLIEFEAAEADAEPLARVLSEVLDDRPGWYADFRGTEESFVVFPGRVYRYPRGDAAGRAEAEAHGRSLGIPEPQLDWPV